MARHPMLTATVLIALACALHAPLGARPAGAAIMPVQLVPGPNEDASPESDEDVEQGDAQDSEDEHGGSRHEDMQDGVLRLPRTGDDEAVKVPPAERLPASPREQRRE